MRLIWLLVPLTVLADGVSFTWENDVVYDHDYGYTNGVKLTYVVGDAAGDRVSHSAVQTMYTPRELDIAEPQPDERPWAGTLYYEWLRLRPEKNTERRLGIQIGVMGPSSYAEDVQTWVHEQIASTIPLGWNNQLGDRPLLSAFYGHRRRLADGKWYDVLGDTYAQLGTVTSFAGAGLELRAGLLPDNFGSYAMEPGPLREAHRFSAHVLAGARGRYVAHNETLNSLDGPIPVGELYAGVGVGYESFYGTFIVTHRTPEWDGGYETEFGAVTLSWSW